MAVKMKDVRAALDPEEPDYAEAAALGPGALPHLRALIAGDDPMLASKAAYLASLIESEDAAEVVALAAASETPAVRVAAAAAARNLPEERAGEVLAALTEDEDRGVRRIARASGAEVSGSEDDGSAEQVASVEEEDEVARPVEPVVTGLMPGETPPGSAPEGTGLMPGEAATGGRMPGERP